MEPATTQILAVVIPLFLAVAGLIVWTDRRLTNQMNRQYDDLVNRMDRQHDDMVSRIDRNHRDIMVLLEGHTHGDGPPPAFQRITDPAD